MVSFLHHKILSESAHCLTSTEFPRKWKGSIGEAAFALAPSVGSCERIGRPVAGARVPQTNRGGVSLGRSGHLKPGRTQVTFHAASNVERLYSGPTWIAHASFKVRENHVLTSSARFVHRAPSGAAKSARCIRGRVK